MLKVALLTNLVATFFMVGLIWFVQVVHYPLFAQVGRPEFVGYELAHSRLTSLVVIPPMLIELLTTVVLVLGRPTGMRRGEALLGGVLLAVIWGSTFLLQVPRHGQLASGFDGLAHAALVATNWLRTVAWSLRGALLLRVVSRMLG